MGPNAKESIMKKDEVKVGTTYRVKVSGNLCDVRITGENPHGGWDGVNAATNRKVRIKSAQRLRARADRPTKRKKIMSLAEYEAEAKTATDGQTASGRAKAASAPTAKKAGKATKEPRAARGRDTGERGAKGAKRTSGLDAAAQVLAEAGEPLNTKGMIERMLAKDLWSTNGRTPSATIYAAILRECATKDDASWFRKVARGKFELSR